MRRVFRDDLRGRTRPPGPHEIMSLTSHYRSQSRPSSVGLTRICSPGSCAPSHFSAERSSLATRYYLTGSDALLLDGSSGASVLLGGRQASFDRQDEKPRRPRECSESVSCAGVSGCSRPLRVESEFLGSLAIRTNTCGWRTVDFGGCRIAPYQGAFFARRTANPPSIPLLALSQALSRSIQRSTGLPSMGDA